MHQSELSNDGTERCKATITGSASPSIDRDGVWRLGRPVKRRRSTIGDFFGHVSALQLRLTPRSRRALPEGGITSPSRRAATATATSTGPSIDVSSNRRRSTRSRQRLRDFEPAPRRRAPPVAADVSSKGLAVDPTNGDVYVDEGERDRCASTRRELRSGRNRQRAAYRLAAAWRSMAATVGLRQHAGSGNEHHRVRLRHSARTRRSTTRRSSTASTTPARAHRRLPGDAGRALRRLRARPAADRLRQRAASPRSTATTRRRSELACASAIRPSARARRRLDAALDGLSLTDDGRVFFDSTEPLAPRDTNERTGRSVRVVRRRRARS